MAVNQTTRRSGLFIQTTLWLTASFFCVGCGSSNEGEETSDDNGQSVVNVISSGATQKTVNIPVNLVESQNSTQSLSLTATADSYSVQLTGCQSGYTATVTDSNVDGLEVYSFDRNCLAKLTQFTVGAKTYYPTAGDPFTTWQAGDKAIFDEAGEPGTAQLAVIVLSTLSNPITGAETISYGWSELIEGSSLSILWTTVGTSAKVEFDSNPPPSFTVKSTELKGGTAGEGGQFEFVMECTTTIGVTNICETVLLSDMDYKLVEDTYSGTISLAEADTLFATAGTSITLPADRVAPGDSGTTNGGFVTVTLDGPDNMATTPDMMLVIRSPGASYQYFNIDVTVASFN